MIYQILVWCIVQNILGGFPMIIRNNFKILRHLSQIEELMKKLEKEKSIKGQSVYKEEQDKEKQAS